MLDRLGFRNRHTDVAHALLRAEPRLVSAPAARPPSLRHSIARAWAILFVAATMCALTAAAVPGSADDAPVTITPRAIPKSRTRSPGAILVDVKLILVPVTVTDSFDAPVSGLPREAFRLFEEGVEQQVQYFAT